jgi:quinol monooxygenase YgiN
VNLAQRREALDQLPSERLRRRDAHGPFDARVCAGDAPFDRVGVARDRLDQRKDLLRGARRREPVGPAQEQPRAERRLERSEAPRHRRVLDAELARCGGERLRVRDGAQVTEIVPIQRRAGSHRGRASSNISRRGFVDHGGFVAARDAPREKGDNVMAAALIVRHRVANWDSWKKVFDEMYDTRKAHGWLSAIVYRDATDPNVVTIVNRVKDLDGAKRYGASDAIRAAMAKGGVQGAPEVFFVDEAEERAY